MALNAPYYLAVGSCVLEPGNGSADYTVVEMGFPEPEQDGYGGYLPAVRTVKALVTGTSASDISANLAALRQQAIKGSILYFKPTLGGNLLSCTIRQARVVEESFDPLRRSVSTPKTAVTITLETDPFWLGPWSSDTSPTVTTVPGHFDVTDITGEVDALLKIRAIFADAGTLAAIGIRPDPAAGYDYLDDYGAAADTSDGNALGAYKKANTGTVDSTLSEHWPYLTGTTEPTIDTNGNRGRHLVLARVDHNATTPANVTIQARTKTTGNAIAESVTVDEIAVATTSVDLVGLELGDVQIPAGQVPDLTSGSGWNIDSVQVQSTTDHGTRTLTAGWDGAHYTVVYKQTYPGFTGRVTAIEYTIDTAPSATIDYAELRIYNAGGTTYAQIVSGIPTTVGTHKVTVSPPKTEVVGSTYAFAIAFESATAGWTMGIAYSNGVYTDGDTTMPYGSGRVAGDDLVFKVWGEVPFGFNTSNPILAACTETTKTINLDYVQRVPVDYAAIIYRRASGTLALFYDGDTDTPYIADTDGTGPAIYDKTEIRAPLRLRPGVTNRVVLGACQADEAIGGATVTYSWRPRFLTATG